MATMNKLGPILGFAAVLAISSGAAYAQADDASGVYPGYGEVYAVDPVGQVNGVAGGAGLKTISAAGSNPAKRSQQPSNAHKLTIRMDYGPYQTITQSPSANFRVGDRVWIDNGTVRRY